MQQDLSGRPAMYSRSRPVEEKKEKKEKKGHVRPSVVALGGRDKVQGVRQGSQGAAPSPGFLEPPWKLPGDQNTERGPGHCVYRSVT